MEEEFSMPPGAVFARTFDTADGQILASLEANDSGNASVVLRRWTSDGLAEVRLGVAGARAPKADEIFVANFSGITADQALAAMRRAEETFPA